MHVYSRTISSIHTIVAKHRAKNIRYTGHLIDSLGILNMLELRRLVAGL